MATARRLFVGLRPPPELAEELHARARTALGRARARGLRLVPAPDLHVTVCFLGEVRESDEARLHQELARALVTTRPCDLVVTTAGAFPAPSRERVLWAGVEEAPRARGRLEPLRHAVVQAIQAVGLEPDGQSFLLQFTPHITLARVRGKVQVSEEFYALRFVIPWAVSEVHLFESQLAAGALERYPVRQTYRLGAQPSDAS